MRVSNQQMKILRNKSEVILLDKKYMKINEESKFQMRTQTFQTSKLLLEKQEETIVTSQKIMLMQGTSNVNNFTPKENSTKCHTHVDSKFFKTSIVITCLYANKTHKLNDQVHICESFLKISNDAKMKNGNLKIKGKVKKVLFEKKKKQVSMLKKNVTKEKHIKMNEQNEPTSTRRIKSFYQPYKKILNKLNLKYQSVNKRTLNRQESINPIKNKLDKTPAYQRYLSLAESNIAEIFTCKYMNISFIAFILYYFHLCFRYAPAVQELLRRNFTLEYLVQIKTVYPNAYIFHQDFIKIRSFGSISKQDEVVLTPTVQVKGGLNEPNGNNVLQAATDASMNKVKTEQEQFLLKLDEPIVILKQKIIRWHPEFDVEKRAKSLFHCNTRLEKALQRLAEAKMISKSKSPDVFSTSKPTNSTKNKVNIMVRTKQTAKALEMMTQIPDLDKEATLYSRLPELAKILHSIFVTEKKGILPLEHVLTKLDNSFKTKLTAAKLEEHLAKDVNLNEVIKMLETVANNKITIS
ncbi:LOW QUALITY PROTEIN: DNA replication factor Cdt1-like [Vespula maculifrons]|uniref:DNA replication factor Cdt1-like n=1 Tax=Vespula maculifrons TaxID=7453 RepID=A0ABD2ANK8_VESMC